MKKITKKILSVLLAAVLFAACLVCYAEDTLITVTVNGIAVDFTEQLDINFEPPYIDEASGRTLVPLRKVLETMGCAVNYNTELKIISIIYPLINSNMALGIDNPWITRMDDISQKEEHLLIDENNSTVVPIIKNGRTMLPIRAVVEALHAYVHWDGSSNTIAISTAEALSNPNYVKVYDKDDNCGIFDSTSKTMAADMLTGDGFLDVLKIPKADANGYSVYVIEKHDKKIPTMSEYEEVISLRDTGNENVIVKDSSGIYSMLPKPTADTEDVYLTSNGVKFIWNSEDGTFTVSDEVTNLTGKVFKDLKQISDSEYTATLIDETTERTPVTITFTGGEMPEWKVELITESN